MPITVLVTGGGGFVSPYLIDELLKKGYRVRAMIRRRGDNSIPPRLTPFLRNENFELMRGDVTNFHDVLNAMWNVGVVFHLASQSFVPDSVENPSYTFEVNAGGTQNVLSCARIHKHCRVVLCSSSEVYGLQYVDELPISETNPLRPQSPYATSKLYGENLARNYFDNYGTNVVITRAFNHEGIGRGHHFFTASVIRQLVMVAAGESNVLRVGDVTTERDWSHVKDVVDAYILVAERGKSGETYVIGSGISTSGIQFIERVAIRLNILGKFEIMEEADRKRRADVPRLQANPEKVKALGWIPQRGLTEIIGEMIHFYSAMTPSERANILS